MSNTREDKLISIEAGIKEKIDSVIGDMTAAELLILTDINTLSSLVLAGVATDEQKDSLLTHYRANPDGLTDSVEVATNWELRRGALLSLLKALNSLAGLFKTKIDSLDNIQITEYLDGLATTEAGITEMATTLSNVN